MLYASFNGIVEVVTAAFEDLRAVLAEALPWVMFLPEPDVDQLLAELISVAQGAASLANLSSVAVLLAQWRHTAEVHADPVLLKILTREPEGDFGRVVVADEDR